MKSFEEQVIDHMGETDEFVDRFVAAVRAKYVHKVEGIDFNRLVADMVEAATVSLLRRPTREDALADEGDTRCDQEREEERFGGVA